MYFNVPYAKNYHTEEEVRLAENTLTVRMRIVTNKDIPMINEIFDSIIRRRFLIYQKWLADVKKADLIEKSEQIEIPIKCFQNSSQSPENDFEYLIEKEEQGDKVSLSKEIVFGVRSLIQMVIFGQGDDSTESKEAQTDRRLQMVYANQFGLLALLCICLIIVSFR